MYASILISIWKTDSLSKHSIHWNYIGFINNCDVTWPAFLLDQYIRTKGNRGKSSARNTKKKRQENGASSHENPVQHSHANSLFISLSLCLSPPTVRLNEHRPAAPESLGVAGTVFPKLAIAPSRIVLREPVRILTFEFGEGLLVAVLGALLALMLGYGVRRVEAKPLLIVSLGRHPILLRAPGRPSEVEGAGFNVHARPRELPWHTARSTRTRNRHWLFRRPDKGSRRADTGNPLAWVRRLFAVYTTLVRSR